MQNLLAFFLFTLFSCTLLFAQDEPSGGQVSWITGMWNAHKGMITLVGAVLLIVLAVFLMRYESKVRAGRMKAYAQKHGWAFLHHDNGELDRLLDTLCPGRKYHAYNIRQVQAHKPSLLMFEITYNDPASAHAKPLTATVCLAELARPEPGRPEVQIYPMNHLDFTKDRIDTKDKAFAKEFTVASSDAATATRLVPTTLRQALLADVNRGGAVPIRFEIYPGHLLAVTDTMRDLTREEDMDRMLAMTREVAAAIDAQRN